MVFYDANNAFISEVTSPTLRGEDSFPPAAAIQWQDFYMTNPTPANAAFATLKISIPTKSTSKFTTTFYIDNLLVEPVIGTGPCTSVWSCTPWSDAANSCGTRTCTDTNACATPTNKPLESQACGGGGGGTCSAYIYILQNGQTISVPK